MSNEKQKSENYSNLGGINSKASPYALSPLEFLDIINMDFFTPSSLSHRWGSTMYVGQTFPGKISTLFESSFLNGSSFVFIGHSGGLWYGATTGQSQGMSLTNVGITQTSNIDFWTNDFTFVGALNAFALNVLGLGNYYQNDVSLPFFASEGQAGLTTTTPFAASAQTQDANVFSSQTFVNNLFLADGNQFYRFDGATTYTIGLPLVSLVTAKQYTVTTGSVPLSTNTGQYALYASYVNNRGFEGNIRPIGIVNTNLNGSTVGFFTGASGFIFPAFNFNVPQNIGISSINVYYYYQSSSLIYSIGATTNSVFFDFGATNLWTLPYVLYANLPANSTQVAFNFGGSLPQANIGQIPDSTINSYVPNFGITFTLGSTASGFVTPPPGATQGILSFAYTNQYPSMLEIFGNRMMLAGFANLPSTVRFSDTGEPEGYTADGNFEVRTNDADIITAIRSYSTYFAIWKNRSFHLLSGDTPQNFYLRQITDQYGCLNNRCTVTYDNYLVFLDQKGIILWDGSSIQNISLKIQPIFDSMNYQVARLTACMVHDKLRNQVLIAIPTGSSTVNNLTIIYDYVVGAWTKYDGFTPSVFAQILGRNNLKNAFYGDTSGRVNWFGSSFLADNGVGFTTYFKTRFLHDMGDSTQKMYRRLFLNTDSPASSTLTFNVNFFQDYGSSAVLSTTMVLSQFQNRLEYGVSSKSLAFEISNLQTAIPLRIHGFTIESRMLRRV